MFEPSRGVCWCSHLRCKSALLRRQECTTFPTIFCLSTERCVEAFTFCPEPCFRVHARASLSTYQRTVLAWTHAYANSYCSTMLLGVRGHDWVLTESRSLSSPMPAHSLAAASSSVTWVVKDDSAGTFFFSAG